MDAILFDRYSIYRPGIYAGPVYCFIIPSEVWIQHIIVHLDRVGEKKALRATSLWFFSLVSSCCRYVIGGSGYQSTFFERTSLTFFRGRGRYIIPERIRVIASSKPWKEETWPTKITRFSTDATWEFHHYNSLYTSTEELDVFQCEDFYRINLRRLPNLKSLTLIQKSPDSSFIKSIDIPGSVTRLGVLYEHTLSDIERIELPGLKSLTITTQRYGPYISLTRDNLALNKLSSLTELCLSGLFRMTTPLPFPGTLLKLSVSEFLGLSGDCLRSLPENLEELEIDQCNVSVEDVFSNLPPNLKTFSIILDQHHLLTSIRSPLVRKLPRSITSLTLVRLDIENESLHHLPPNLKLFRGRDILLVMEGYGRNKTLKNIYPGILIKPYRNLE